MPTFDITEDAFEIVEEQMASGPAAPVPGLSPVARQVLDASEAFTQPSTQVVMRWITADRAVTKELRDWFIQVEDLLHASGDARDRARAPSCRAAANALIRAFATGSDIPPPKARR